jgi:hypothetical protein
MRWGVYAFAIITLCAAGVSFWLQPGIEAEYVPTPNTAGTPSKTVVHLYDGVLLIQHDIPAPHLNTSVLPPPGWHVRRSLRTPPPVTMINSWYHFPRSRRGFSIGSTMRRYEVPLIPILFLLLCTGAALHAWARMRRYPEGQCRRCGYALEGLTSNTCPECGVERG